MFKRNPFEGGRFETEPGRHEQAPEARFGRNVRLDIRFMRHEEPGKTPEGMSADFLTEKGKARAAAKGREIDTQVKGYASPKLRAQETLDLALQNADEDVRVINQKLADLKTGAKGQKLENRFNIRLRPELDTAKNFAALMGEAKTWAKEQLGAGSKRAEYDLIVQYYLDHPERAKELGVTTPDEAAEEIAFAASREIGMTKWLYSGSEVELVNVTHGPKLEPFLQRVLLQEDGSRGFKELTEIGGALNQGEEFKLHSSTGPDGGQGAVLELRHQTYGLDTQQIETMADNYRQRREREKSDV